MSAFRAMHSCSYKDRGGFYHHYHFYIIFITENSKFYTAQSDTNSPILPFLPSISKVHTHIKALLSPMKCIPIIHGYIPWVLREDRINAKLPNWLCGELLSETANCNECRKKHCSVSILFWAFSLLVHSKWPPVCDSTWHHR